MRPAPEICRFVMCAQSTLWFRRHSDQCSVLFRAPASAHPVLLPVFSAPANASLMLLPVPGAPASACPVLSCARSVSIRSSCQCSYRFRTHRMRQPPTSRSPADRAQCVSRLNHPAALSGTCLCESVELPVCAQEPAECARSSTERAIPVLLFATNSKKCVCTFSTPATH